MSYTEQYVKTVSFFQRSLNTIAIGQQLTVERIQIEIPQLHPALEGFRIVQLSDFHIDPFFLTDLLREAVQTANRLQPDLIVLTGDYITEEGDAIFELTPLLAGLNARYGVYTILGNHDIRKRRRLKAVQTGLREINLPILNNQGFTLGVGEGQLYLAGLDDGLWGRPNLKAALAKLPKATPVVLLAHEPDPVEQYARDPRITLQLSGHTHGGQIRLPLVGAPYLPELGYKYVQGLYRVNSTWLYTNRGIGSIRLPVRINCLPELTELTLVAKTGES